jgi:hypothetical protein
MRITRKSMLEVQRRARFGDRGRGAASHAPVRLGANPATVSRNRDHERGFVK